MEDRIEGRFQQKDGQLSSGLESETIPKNLSWTAEGVPSATKVNNCSSRPGLRNLPKALSRLYPPCRALLFVLQFALLNTRNPVR
jgi:hypothetical protein